MLASIGIVMGNQSTVGGRSLQQPARSFNYDKKILCGVWLTIDFMKESHSSNISGRCQTS